MTEFSLSRRFDFLGHAIAYDVFGEGLPLVCIHGTPFSSVVWRDIARELSHRFQVICFDLLGYGQSDMPDTDVSLGVQNNVLAALFAELALDRPRVLAHDFGGATALRGHILNGLQYSRLILIDPVAIRPWGSPFVQHVRDHESAFAGLPAYLQRALLETYIDGAVARPIATERLAPLVSPWLSETGQKAFYRQIAQMDPKYTDAIESRFDEVGCPTSLLWGVDDEWIPVDSGRRLSRLIPNCQYREIPFCGHLMQWDAPEAIVAEALNFFTATPA